MTKKPFIGENSWAEEKAYASASEEVERDRSASRREALRRMGKFAAFTPPAVTALLTTDVAEAWAQSGKPTRNGPPDDFPGNAFDGEFPGKGGPFSEEK